MYWIYYNNLVRVVDDLLFYESFEFHKIKNYYKAKSKNNIVYFRCKNYRKDESKVNINFLPNIAYNLIIEKI